MADRFHLLCNLTSAVERVLDSKRGELAQACKPDEPRVEPFICSEVLPRPTCAQERSQQSRERRLEIYNKVVELHGQGLTDRAIGRALDIGRKTVGRFLRAQKFPERATPQRQAPRVNKFREYLKRRWAEGCHNATKLWREIQTEGYIGGRSMVSTMVSTFRTPGTKYHRKRSQYSSAKGKRRVLSPRQAAMLIARNPERWSDTEKQLVERLELSCPEVALLHPLVRAFSALLKGKDAAALQPWIDRATAAGMPAIKNFCDGLLRDRAAVTAAITLQWSNGQVEGQVHRLKLVKRQMYGRASFELLRARVLPFVPDGYQRSP